MQRGSVIPQFPRIAGRSTALDRGEHVLPWIKENQLYRRNPTGDQRVAPEWPAAAKQNVAEGAGVLQDVGGSGAPDLSLCPNDRENLPPKSEVEQAEARAPVAAALFRGNQAQTEDVMSNDLRAEPAYFRGKFGVMLMDSGKFISESRLPAIIDAARKSDPQTAEMLRSAAARIAGLRDVVEPSLVGGRP